MTIRFNHVRSAQARVIAAEAELIAARAALHRTAAPLEASIEQRKTTWVLAGGFLGGFALSFLPMRLWARVGAFAGGGAALVARSMLTPIIAGALMSRIDPQAGAETEPT